MPLYLKDGKLLVEGGALGTGAACCCNKCSGPCDGETPCPEGCACVDGACVADSGACCLPDGTCVDGVNECPPQCVCEYRVGEATYDEATDSFVCPEGQREEGTFCFESTIVPACPDGTCETCEACPPENLTASGPAPSGTFHPGQTCADNPCFESWMCCFILGPEGVTGTACAPGCEGLGIEAGASSYPSLEACQNCFDCACGNPLP